MQYDWVNRSLLGYACKVKVIINNRELVTHPEHSSPLCDQFKQAIDIRVFPRIQFCILGMFRIKLKTFLRCVDGDRAKNLTQMVVNNQRPTLTLLVFNSSGNGAVCCNEFERGKM